VGGELKVKSPNKTQISLRLNKSMDAALTAAANKVGVSKNAYIIMLLADSLGNEFTQNDSGTTLDKNRIERRPIRCRSTRNKSKS
jgi:hypothetical protein